MSGFWRLYPARWAARVASLQSVIGNWKVLQEIWNECLETKLDPDIRGRIIGVKHQIKIFDYFYGVNLCSLFLKYSDM